MDKKEEMLKRLANLKNAFFELNNFWIGNNGIGVVYLLQDYPFDGDFSELSSFVSNWEEKVREKVGESVYTIDCNFITVWDSGDRVITSGKYNSITGYVKSNIVSFDGITGSLEREYIILEEGTEIEVCMECHEYIIKGTCCSNPGCDG